MSRFRVGYVGDTVKQCHEPNTVPSSNAVAVGKLNQAHSHLPSLPFVRWLITLRIAIIDKGKPT